MKFIANIPERPVAESYKDNDKIEEYNKKVDEYNKYAEEYNKNVDREFEEASRAAEEQNVEIDKNNAAENERVKAVEERNEAALKAAKDANDQIDKDNAEEEARVKSHNENEDAKAEASVKAKKDAEDYNEAAKVHNEAVAAYAEEYAVYEAANEQYKIDLAYEQKILAAGYASVEQYNDRINKAYNEPAAKSKTMNASTEIKSVSETYKVTEAKEKSGVNVSVKVKHIFEGTDVSYSQDFTIDANDTIVLNSIAALGSSTQPGYATFYYKTDENHSIGYWCESYSVMETTARRADYGWNCGDEHVISYSEGKLHAFDEEVIEMTYYYFWTPLRTAKTYNVPVAPTKPENPGEAREMVEVPGLYTPQYQTFEKKAYVEAELEKIEAANIMEHIADPIKAAYLTLLGYMDLFDVPAEEIAEEIIPAATVAEETDKKDIPAAPATAEAAPAAEEILEAEVSETAMIAEQEVPMTGITAEGSAWALLNLIMAVITGIISAVLLVGYFGREEREEENEEDKTDRKGFARVMSLIPAVGAAIAFILTENMSNPMIFTDRWTILMAVILLIQAIVAIIAKKSDEENEDDNIAEAINA